MPPIALTDEQLRQQVIYLASQAELPIDEEHLTVKREDTRTTVDTEYTRTVELFPGFVYPWSFTVHVDAYAKAQRLPGLR